jgi:tetratricopeptide (TPR) repeat protein/transglutaminase-like putative cysteine protease
MKKLSALLLLLFFLILPASRAQTGNPAPAKPTSVPAVAKNDLAKKAPDYSAESFIIQKYSTDITYAADGTGERLITVQVKVQSEEAVRQFGVLDFPYESRYEHIDFIYVRVRKQDGSVVATSDAEAQDQPAEVTRQAPFYSDLRDKQLPVKSLSVGDTLEYQVRQVRTVAATPGQFWFTTNFVKDGIVLEETVSLDVPKDKYVKVQGDSVKPEVSEAHDRRIYRWKTSNLEKSGPESKKHKNPLAVLVEPPPDIAVSTFKDWQEVGHWYGDLQKDRITVTPEIQAKATALTKDASGDEAKVEAVYTYVATQVRYIGVDFGIGRYQPHASAEVLENQYGDCKDKHTLLAALLKALGYDAWPVLVGTQHVLQSDVPSPGQFDHVFTAVTLNKTVLWMDSTPEVAPFRLLMRGLRDKLVLAIPNDSAPILMKTPVDPPFKSEEKYEMEETLSSDGDLKGHFDISTRGDNELLDRVLFHQSPRNRWDTVAQELSFYRGFSGTVSNVDVSSPERLAEPFHLSYDYSRTSSGDWQNHRIMAPVARFQFFYDSDDSKPTDTILLGIPGDSVSRATITLPTGYHVQLPSRVNVHTSFGDYTATYAENSGKLVVERDVHLNMGEIPASQWDEYQKFRNKVTSDEETFIQLVDGNSAKATTSSATSPKTFQPEAGELISDAYNKTKVHQLDDAKQELDRAAKLNPSERGLWSGYAFLYMSQGRTEEAIDACLKEITKYPENLDVYRTMAGLQSTSHPDAAVETLHTLLKRAPQDVFAHQQLAGLLMSQKRYAEAITVLKEAVMQSPEVTRFQVMLGTAQIKNGDKELGVATLRTVLTGATDESVLNDAAYELADANMELPLARTSCEKALKLLDEMTSKINLSAITEDDLRHIVHLAETWDTMAWVLYRQGDLTGAEDYSKASWTLDARPTIGLHLGEIYQNQGRKEEAVHIYRLAVVSGNGLGDSVEEAQSRLKAVGLPQVAHDDAQLRQELMDLRTVKFAAPGDPKGKGTVYVLFSPGPKIEGVQATDGSDAVKSAASALIQTRFNVPFPANSGARIMRRGKLSCSDVLKECMFAMALPEYTHKTP